MVFWWDRITIPGILHLFFVGKFVEEFYIKNAKIKEMPSHNYSYPTILVDRIRIYNYIYIMETWEFTDEHHVGDSNA